jgi:branched-chain amino acid transport system permease protein
MAHGALFLVGAYAGVAVFYPLYDAGNAYAWVVIGAVAVRTREI